MKTLIKKLFVAASAIAVLTATSAYAGQPSNAYVVTNLTQVKNINKISISGNVNLILIQDAQESVRVYDNYYAKNALVQQQGDELRISSFEKEPLTVTVRVNNLSAITASDNSTVKTYGKFNLLGLEVILKDHAKADINAHTVSLYTSVKDQADLKLSGTTDSHTAVLSSVGKLSTDNFIAQSSAISSDEVVYARNPYNGFDEKGIALLEKIKF